MWTCGAGLFCGSYNQWKFPKLQTESMAWNFASSPSLPTLPLRFHVAERSSRKNKVFFSTPTSTEKHLLSCKASQSEGFADEPSTTGSSARTQLNLLEQMTSSTSPGSGYENDGVPRRPTIREQLSELIGDRDGEFSLPLGKKVKASVNSLTISQKRNIKRQTYLNEVARRNDSVFYATIGAFVVLPPVVILSVAVITGYVELFP